MKQTLLLFIAFFCLLVVPAQARVGSGRSFGSRGSRAVSPRYQPYAPAQSLGRTPYGSPYRTAPSPFEPRIGAAGGFWRGLAGGFAGSFLGSLLLRGWGGGYSYGEGSGVGLAPLLIDLLFLFAVGYLVLRWWRRTAEPLAPRLPQWATESGPAYSAAPTPIYSAPAEDTDRVESPEDALARYDAAFDPDAFKEARTDDFFKIQAAFMARDLSSIQGLLAPEIAPPIEADIAVLKATCRINRLENVTVRQIDIAEAWQEDGKEYATVHFRANLLDYTVDEKSSAVVSGSTTSPVKFEEYWTFVRDLGSRQWQLSAIEQAP